MLPTYILNSKFPNIYYPIYASHVTLIYSIVFKCISYIIVRCYFMFFYSSFYKTIIAESVFFPLNSEEKNTFFNVLPWSEYSERLEWVDIERDREIIYSEPYHIIPLQWLLYILTSSISLLTWLYSPTQLVRVPYNEEVLWSFINLKSQGDDDLY